MREMKSMMADLRRSTLPDGALVTGRTMNMTADGIDRLMGDHLRLPLVLSKE